MSYHVLIVDDDPAICKLLSKVMISNEMDPLVVNSGAAALDWGLAWVLALGDLFVMTSLLRRQCGQQRQ